MNQDTPATEIKSKDLSANCLALEKLLGRLSLAQVSSVADIRYGLGGWAQVVRERFPDVPIEGWEQDSETAQKSWKDSGVTLHIARWQPSPIRASLVLADFNTLTALKRQLLDELLAQIKSPYLIFTDVACSKLHLNYKSYGLSRPYLSEYWKRFSVRGYLLKAWEQEHHAASTALFERRM